MTHASLEERGRYSRERLSALTDAVGQDSDLTALDRLCIYVTGSYGRGDASEESDVDVFFIQRGVDDRDGVSRVQKTLADAALIRICRRLGFPEFTKGGIYLDIHYLNDICEHLGSKEDDHRNFFTARMLLLLESVPILHPKTYEMVIDQVLKVYWRDFDDHKDSFRPTFLLNDIMRYWRTMCLNYEARRTNTEAGRGELVKNFKLKYSRLLTCFSMIVPLAAHPPGIDLAHAAALVRQRPFERLMSVSTSDDARSILAQLEDEYGWFLDQTKRKQELLEIFEDSGRREDLFARAEQFGDRMYALLDAVTYDDKAKRYLIL